MKIAIIDELHDIKRSGVYFSTEGLKAMYEKNGIECEIIGIRKRGKLFNLIICLPFLRELFIFPVWNLTQKNRLAKEGYDSVFYQCSTALMLIKKTSFKRIIYTRALLARRLDIYAKLRVTFRIKLIIRVLRPFINFAEKHSFRHADRVVASKVRFSTYLQHQFGINKDKFVVIPQMIDLKVDKRSFVKIYDVLFIGRLSVPKNWPMIEKLAAISDLKLAAATPEQSEPKGMPDNVSVFHRVPQHELSKLIKQSRVFIMPSFNEEGPRVTLEAMYCGLPVVASIEGSGEFVEPGKNGFVIESDNPEEYLNAIKKLLSSKKLYQKMSVANPAKAAEYTPENLGKRYIDAMKF